MVMKGRKVPQSKTMSVLMLPYCLLPPFCGVAQSSFLTRSKLGCQLQLPF